MRTLLEAQIPVASSCDGEGICRKCKITVKDQINAQDLTEYEKLAFEMSEIKINQRLACQVTIRQELTIDASYW
jgi:2Fe-2S ferredoxin